MPSQQRYNKFSCVKVNIGCLKPPTIYIYIYVYAIHIIQFTDTFFVSLVVKQKMSIPFAAIAGTVEDNL
jgi:hypothetical protein